MREPIQEAHGFAIGDRVRLKDFVRGHQRLRVVGFHAAVPQVYVRDEMFGQLLGVAAERLCLAEPLDWKAETWRIHVARAPKKRWPVGSDEDRRHLAMGLAGEVGELLNLISKDWRGDEGAAARRHEIAEEIADIRIYLALLARAYGLDEDRQAAAKLPKLYGRWPETSPAAAAARGEATEGP